MTEKRTRIPASLVLTVSVALAALHGTGSSEGGTDAGRASLIALSTAAAEHLYFA